MFGVQGLYYLTKRFEGVEGVGLFRVWSRGFRDMPDERISGLGSRVKGSSKWDIPDERQRGCGVVRG